MQTLSDRNKPSPRLVMSESQKSRKYGLNQSPNADRRCKAYRLEHDFRESMETMVPKERTCRRRRVKTVLEEVVHRILDVSLHILPTPKQGTPTKIASLLLSIHRKPSHACIRMALISS